MRSKVCSDAEMVQSASPGPSATFTLPSSMSTFHWPGPSMSNRYDAVRPAVLDGSTRDARVSKNSRAVSAMPVSSLVVAASLSSRDGLGLQSAARRRQQQREQETGDGRRGADEERGAQVDRVRERAQRD